MRPEARKFLFDIQQAAAELARFSAGKSWDDYSEIIAFRNILIHGYAQVDDGIVWDILQSKLPTLVRQIDSLLEAH